MRAAGDRWVPPGRHNTVAGCGVQEGPFVGKGGGPPSGRAHPGLRDRRAAVRPRTRGYPATLSATAALWAVAASATFVGLEAQGADQNGNGNLVPADRGAPFRGLVRTAVAVRRSGPIVVDGRLDEPAWMEAPVFDGFIQKDPFDGEPAMEDTQVRILFDDDALYIGARLLDSSPDRVSRQLVRRDQEGNADFFEVSLDPNLDRRTGYQFTVSAANVQSDKYLYDDTRDDRAWDAVWASAVHHDEWGWSVEIRIPLSQLRYDPSDGPQTWGVNFSRRRLLTNERTFFSPESRAARGVVSRFGLLDGVDVRRGARRIEARPYVLSQVRTGPAAEGDPFFDGRELGGRMGADIRYGLGSAFTLDATFNPDFGQVESDPATINLSAFETFLQERRPFFVEDARILDFSLSGMQNQLFYSRRIGRAPQGRAPAGSSFVDLPEAANIVGAAKVTGRTPGGLSLGVLTAVTEEARGRALMVGEGRTEAFLAEPRTGYGVFRLQKDYRQGQSVVGGIATALHRQLPGDGSFDFLPSDAFSGGIDFEHTWRDRTWAVHGFLAGSHVVGDSTAMIRIQRSSNHYRQRPDATRLSVDSTATSLSGLEWRLQLERRNGRNWNGAVWAAQVTPGFEVNDLGFSRSQERLDGGARISYRQLEPRGVVRNWNGSVSTFHNVSHEVLDNPRSWSSWRAAHITGSVFSNVNVTFTNYWNLNLDLRASPETVSRSATRGGPIMTDPASLGGGIRFRTDGRRAVNLRPSVNYSRTALGGGSEFRASLEVGVRPSPRLEFELQPSWNRNSDGAQYVAATRALPYGPTYGTRYIFGELERETVSMTTRLNVAFTPTLTLQFYAQPLLSSGAYVGFRQLESPRTYDFIRFQEGTHQVLESGNGCAGGDTCVDASGRRYLDFDGDGRADYSFRNPDFNVRSLRGNAVLRWEYRPGSTLFLVWQQRRSEDVGEGSFELGRDLRALGAAPASNVFLLKLNYWLGL